MLRVSIEYLDVTRDVDLLQTGNRTQERYLFTTSGPLPSFDELRSHVGTVFNLPSPSSFVLSHCFYSLHPCRFGTRSKNSLLLQDPDVVNLGAPATSFEWDSILHAAGLTGSFLMGNLLVKVKPVEPGETTRLRQKLLRSSAYSESKVEKIASFSHSVAALHLQVRPPISPQDLKPVMFFLSLEPSVVRGVPIFHSLLSDGIHSFRALLHPDMLPHMVCNMTAYLEDFEIVRGVLTVKKVKVKTTQSFPLIVGEPTPFNVPRWPDRAVRKPLNYDILALLFQLVADEASPHPRRSETELKSTFGLLSRLALVSREWNRIITPLLYRNVLLAPSHMMKPGDPGRSFDAIVKHSLRLKSIDVRGDHTNAIRKRERRSLTGLLDGSTSFPVLRTIRGLRTSPSSGVGMLQNLSVVAPELRELGFGWRFGVDDEEREPTTIDLPESLQTLDVTVDNYLAQSFFSKLIRKDPNDLESKRSLPNLTSLHFDFIVRDGDSPLALDPALDGLRDVLAHVGPTLKHLTLLEQEDPDVTYPSLPDHVLLSCPSLLTLSISHLRILPLLIQGHPTLEQLDLGGPPSSLATSDPFVSASRKATFGGFDFFIPLLGDVRDDPIDGAAMEELVAHFRREKLPKLRRVRLACFDFGRLGDRLFSRLTFYAEQLNVLGIEVVDCADRVWWNGPEVGIREQVQLPLEEDEVQVVEDDPPVGSGAADDPVVLL